MAGPIFSIIELSNNLQRCVRGDLSVFHGPKVPDTIAGRVRAQQIMTVTRYTCGMMLANIFNACVFLVALWTSPLFAPAIVWAFAVISLASFVYLKQSARKGSPAPVAMSDRVIRRAVMYALLLGGIWGALPVLFFDEAGIDAKLVIICLCIGMLCGGAFTLAPIPAAALGFVAPLACASGYAIIRFDNPVQLLLVGLLIVYTFVLMRGVVTYACQTTEKVMAHIQSEQAAHTDSLTGLPNRLAFNEALDAFLTRTIRYGDGFAVLYCDLDGFKQVNDQHGHAGGDELLRQVAARLASCTRDGDIIARLGGDEFALIAANADKPENSMSLAERILKAFSAPFAVEGSQVYCGVSMGISLAPVDGTTTETILAKSDAALYSAKESGKSTYRFFTPEHDERVRERRLVGQELRRAIRDRELHLAFQPIVDLGASTVCGFEALVRWNNKRAGPVSPAIFIPIAEEIGVIQELGEWVIRESVMVAATWPEGLRLAINASALQFRTESLVTTLMEALEAHSVSPSRIEVEITESTVISESETVAALLAGLRKHGVRVALDDFGTGYSSLRYVLELPLDKVKIDRSFVASIATDQASAALVKAIIGLAHDLGMVVTAEGIETNLQRECVAALRCDEGQGYYFSAPLLVADLDDFIRGEFPAEPLRLAS